MKSRTISLTCWFWLQRHTRSLRWFVRLAWPLWELARKIAIELELRRCERSWGKR